MNKTLFKTFAFIVIAALIGITHAQAPVNRDESNIAINGYDTVAYFTEGKAVKGTSEYEFVWHDTRWLFSSDNHRNLFAATPERYAPQFGGYCAGAMTRGVEVKADPEVWTIVDGRLYMKLSKQARDRWLQEPQENIRKANKHWATKVQQN